MVKRFTFYGRVNILYYILLFKFVNIYVLWPMLGLWGVKKAKTRQWVTGMLRSCPLGAILTQDPCPERAHVTECMSLHSSHHPFSARRSGLPPWHPSGSHNRGSGLVLPPLHEGSWEQFLLFHFLDFCPLPSSQEKWGTCHPSPPHWETICDLGYANNSFNSFWLTLKYLVHRYFYRWLSSKLWDKSS